MATDQTSEEKKKIIHELLPFWTREMLAMKDEAERTRKAREPSVKEDS